LTQAPDRASLWRHADFRRLWAAQSLSAFGNRITRTAVPIIAINTLAASPAAVAILSAAGFLPVALAGLLGGGFVERQPKRALMVAMDAARFGLVLLIPLAAWAGILDLWILGAVTVLVGAASALFQNADTAYLPRLVGAEYVIEGNAKLQATDSIAEVAGPGVAGVLIDLVGAPMSIILDALTFLWSLLWLRQISAPPDERAPAREANRARRSAISPLRADLTVGWRAVMTPAPLRATFFALLIYYVSGGGFLTLYMLLTLRVLGLSASAVGLIISVGGVGGLLGALIAERLVRALGFGPAILASLVFGEIGLVLLLAAAAGAQPSVPFLVAHQLLGDAGGVAFMILTTSLRQGIVAPGELARANGLFQIAAGVIVPVCGLVAGILAELVGVRAAAIIGVGTGLLAILPCLAPALLRLRTAPGAAAAANF
jgi:MFS family permease